MSTQTVLKRIRKALIPVYKGNFFGDLQPDLYAPFWIATTLIFVLTAAGNMGAWLNTDSISASQWEYQTSKMVTAVGMIYGLQIAIPLTIYCALTNVGSDVTLMEMMSLYGYSYFIFIPAGLICITPIYYLRLGSWFVAALWSLVLLFKTCWTEVATFLGAKKFIVAIIFIIGHGLLALTAVFYFFN